MEEKIHRMLKLEDILLPGATLEAKVLDMNDADTKEFFDKAREEQEKAYALKKVPPEVLNLVITI